MTKKIKDNLLFKYPKIMTKKLEMPYSIIKHILNQKPPKSAFQKIKLVETLILLNNHQLLQIGRKLVKIINFLFFQLTIKCSTTASKP
jgi:hypothetical protein